MGTVREDPLMYWAPEIRTAPHDGGFTSTWTVNRIGANSAVRIDSARAETVLVASYGPNDSSAPEELIHWTKASPAHGIACTGYWTPSVTETVLLPG